MHIVIQKIRPYQPVFDSSSLILLVLLVSESRSLLVWKALFHRIGWIKVCVIVHKTMVLITVHQKSLYYLVVFSICAKDDFGVVGTVPAFQLNGARYFNFYPGIACVCFICILPSVISRGGPDILLATHSGIFSLVLLSSVLIHSLAPPTGIWPTDIWFVTPERCKSYIGGW